MELFGTAGIRGGVDRVRPELAVRVGRAAARAADGATFVVGRDGRTTGDGLAAAVTAGLTAGGSAVRRVGVVPTPALAYASRGRHGVMVTASHNPPGDNGLKLFADGVEYDAAAEERVAAGVEDDAQADWAAWGAVGHEETLDDYRAGVVEYARGHGAPLDGLRVVADCGNGVAAHATPGVLRELGARVVTLNATVDGHFPGRASKPTRESLGDLRAFLADDEATLGVAHDGDADRIVVLDGEGEVVDRNTVLAILADHYVRAGEADDPVVVTTPDASARIDERVAAAGGRVERARLGAIHEGAAESDGDVVFAAEPWKHLHPAWGGWIDGVASAAVVARLVAESGLAALRAPVTERPYRKLSVDCPDDLKASVMADLRERLPDAFSEAEATFDHGIRLDRPDGSWVLVRPSGTEPKVRVYVESEEIEALAERATRLVGGAVERATDR
ncbi:MAG: phosphomannomutase [Haloferacaceae archaeon]